jgi:hypothetical protein
MRWWLQTYPRGLFAVDNASVGGMDFAALPEGLWMVQWTEGRGEIEYFDPVAKANLSGLRESFEDVTPYCSFFQQFMRLLPGLTLPQAKKIQIELVEAIYEYRRELPIEVDGRTWPADDGSVGVMTAARLGAGSHFHWTPVDEAVPIRLARFEISVIATRIAERQQGLYVTRSTKIVAIRALTDIADVIDYDVTTGW